MGNPGYERETLKLSEHADLLGKNSRRLDENRKPYWTVLGQP
jgi:hypothetical protein